MKNRRIGFTVLAILLSCLLSSSLQAQLLTKEAAQVDSMIMANIESNLVVPTTSQISNSRWVYLDELGERVLAFDSNGKFKLKNNGAMGIYSKSSGTWYIYDRYVVLDVKKEKIPMYHVSYNGEILLLDQQSIDVMRKLILGFVAKDQLVAGLNDDTIFGFLKGFKRND